MEKLTGILLCGGKSLRMGTDKALLELHNQPMVSYPLKVLQQWCSEILISANDTRLDYLGYPVIRDEIEDIGPIGGLFSCLKQSTSNINLVLACDMPMVNGILLGKMLPMAHKYDVVVPLVNQRAEPLYALYHKRILETIKSSIDQNIYSLQKLLSQVNVYYMEIVPGENNELYNVNSPSELVNYGQPKGNSA